MNVAKFEERNLATKCLEARARPMFTSQYMIGKTKGATGQHRF